MNVLLRESAEFSPSDLCRSWYIRPREYDNSGLSTWEFTHCCAGNAVLAAVRGQLCYGPPMEDGSGRKCCLVLRRDVLDTLPPVVAARIHSLTCSETSTGFTEAFQKIWEEGIVCGQYPAYRNRMLKISESIDVGHREMSIENVLRKRREHAGTVIFGSNITMWQVVEKLALTVDRSDAALGTTSQFVHSLQVYEAMLANNKTEEWYLLLGILHDVGKTLSLTGEDDFYVDGSNLILSCPAEHSGLDACVVTYSHDEFGYQKFLECCPGVDLPEEFLYGVRYHSLHSVDPRWLSEKDVQNFAWLFDDFTVYDHGTKNGLNTPPLEVMFSAKRLVDKWFPDPIVW
ncbi:Inositol oxygenase 1, variant 4 [Perkinsus olseni]|uniref:Inositol oxygenase n=3 Tax=Perkinsus olseni TaxID=32597 RepID=A0A7J6UGE9_PEROL|nr:Inositol oxygenase 1, variant 4 [Perkinsus olseni]